MNDKTRYWLDLCDDDLITAKALLNAGRFLHLGFFCHSIVEKALKAMVSAKTDEMPPKIHDLPKLASLGAIWSDLSEGQKELMKKLVPLQIETRYPAYKENVSKTLTPEYCKHILTDSEAFLCWIKQRLET